MVERPCSAVCFDEIQKRFLVANNGGEVCPLLEPYCQFFKFIVENNVTIAQIENDVDIRQRMDALVQKSLEEKYKEKETRLNTLHEVLRAMNNKEAVDEEFLDAEIEKISQRLRKLNEEKSALPVNEDQLSMRIQQLEQLSNLWKDVNLTKAQSFFKVRFNNFRRW